ncbi:hypothetical protein PJL18_03696 [Paenarthrobacter nicotinovorans]|nr:hypothetical protein [Paenarthrobacter nicotinovorans]
MECHFRRCVHLVLTLGQQYASQGRAGAKAQDPDVGMLQRHSCLGHHGYAHSDAHHGLGFLVVIGQETNGGFKAGVVCGPLENLHYGVGISADNPRLFPEFAHGYFVMVGQRMSFGDEDDGALLENLGGPDGVVFEGVPRVVPEQAEACYSGLEVRNQLIEPGTSNRQADGRVPLLEGADHHGEERSRERGKGTNRQGPPPQTRDLVQVRLCCPDLPDDLPRMACQYLAGFGGNHTTGASVQQRLPHLLLELAQLLRYCRRGVHHGVCRGSDGSLLDNLHEQGEPAEII